MRTGNAVRSCVLVLAAMVASQGVGGAETVEGRVERAGNRAVSMVIYDAQGRPYPNTLTLGVDRNTRLNGVSSVSGLRPNDPVSADVSRLENGEWRADRITRFQEIGARPATPKPSPSLRGMLGNPVARGALTGAASGAIASAASGGKAGKGALVGAGVGAAASLLESLFSQPSRPQNNNVYSDQE